MRRIAPWLLLLACGSANAQAWSGLLDPARAIDWTQVGIPGGIPTRTAICATVTTSNTTAQIQAAIDSCTDGQVVSFGSGTFNITSIYVRKPITLRGQGPNSTYLNVTGNITLGADYWGASGNPQNWTGGLTRGSTVLTVASTTGMAAGQTVILDEHNPSWVVTNGFNYGECNGVAPANSCGRQEDGSPSWFGGGGGARAFGQMTKIVSVDSSTQITVKDPVAYTHMAGLSPQVFTWTYSGQNGNYQGAGIENMRVYSNGNNYTVDISNCDYCYARNLWITQNARAAIRAIWSYGFVIANNYIDSANCGAPTQYGYEILDSSMGLVENNIAFTVTSAMMPQSNFGVVFAYNYIANNSANIAACYDAQTHIETIQFADLAPHLAHNAFELWEGNVTGTLDYDMIWGSGSHSTMFRNRLHGHHPGKTRSTRVLELSAYNRFMNVVGNVLGEPSYHTTYSCQYTVDYGTAGDLTIYDLGWWHGCGGPLNNDPKGGDPPAGPPTGLDPVTRTSLVRWGNWDAVTYSASGATAKGTRWCTGSGTGSAGADAYNTACTEDERGSDGTFPPLTTPSTTLPSSLYLSATAHSSCGTGIGFWKHPGSGYCPPFPPIGPDVTCSTNCASNAASHVAKIPAQLCYEASAKNSDGYLTAYDASSCYTADTGGAIRPNDPIGQKVSQLYERRAQGWR